MSTHRLIAAENNRGQMFEGVAFAHRQLEANMDHILNHYQFRNYKKGMEELRDLVFGVISKGEIPVTIGGDHSTAWGSVSGALEKYGNDFVLIWFDAHADANSFAQSESKNIHGMPVDFLMNDPLIQGFNLKPEQLCYVGLRSIDDYEMGLIKDKKIKYYSSNLDDKWIEIENFVRGKKVYLSIDVDGLDPLYFPCTGTPEGGGVSANDLFKLIGVVKHFGKPIGYDLVEINFDLYQKEEDRTRAVEMSNSILKKIVG